MGMSRNLKSHNSIIILRMLGHCESIIHVTFEFIVQGNLDSD